jgi:endonuclease YncB( thermonuclease family)
VLRRAENCRRGLRFAARTRKTERLSLWLVALTALSITASSAFAQSSSAARLIEGRARIVDGDTLEIGIHRVRLYGIDAPDSDQRCERDGKPWRCGMEATYAMAALIETHWLTCDRRGPDTTGDVVGVCRMGGPKGRDVSREIVRRGWALALRSAGDDYIAAEREAKTAKIGLWSGTFIAPWEWRRTRQRGETGN